MEYIVVEGFEHPVIDRIVDLPLGFSPLAQTSTSGALDYIRGNLFDRSLMKPLPFDLPGVDNDLNEKIHRVMQRAMGDEKSLVYAFGERWGPEANKKDKFFGFLPGNGIHNIHMNQGNLGDYTRDDGVWQDGGLIVHFPDQEEWLAIFLKFQSQAWHTDDRTGHRLVGTVPGYSPGMAALTDASLPPGAPTRIELPDSDEPQGLIRIVAALVNSVASPERETVTLINTASHDIAMDGWSLVDTANAKVPLSGVICAGATKVVPISLPATLSNKGGVITLLDDNGLKIDGVAYTKSQARHPGWTIVF